MPSRGSHQSSDIWEGHNWCISHNISFFFLSFQSKMRPSEYVCSRMWSTLALSCKYLPRFLMLSSGLVHCFIGPLLLGRSRYLRPEAWGLISTRWCYFVSQSRRGWARVGDHRRPSAEAAEFKLNSTNRRKVDWLMDKRSSTSTTMTSADFMTMINNLEVTDGVRLRNDNGECSVIYKGSK